MCVLALPGLATPLAGAEPLGDDRPTMRLVSAGGARSGPATELTAAQRSALAGDTLVPDEATYAREKARADTRANRSGQAQAETGPTTQAPVSIRNWQGVDDPNSAPSDSTGAIGTTRYIETVNRRFAIYNRTSDTPLGSGTLQDLFGTAAGASGNAFDPQVMWDPEQSRFFYAGDYIESGINYLAVGFSKTASPSGPADFCRYFLSTGSDLYDYPKLGDIQGLLVIGANVFGPAGFSRTELVGVTKPPAGAISTCPDGSTLTVSSTPNLQAANGDVAWTPVPANQTDTASTGWAVATRFPGGTYITVFRLTKNISNQLVVGPPQTMTVAGYSTPSSAPQQGTTQDLDTLDTRFTQAVSAIDPSRSSAVAVWTQHTVLGGAGAAVRWYEINPTPATPVPFQSGTQSDGTLYYFNAAISPDRRRNGANAQFGANMALAYNRSSTGQKVDIVAVGKVGTNAVTAPLLIKASTGVIDDFSCNTSPTRPFCRWGDYAAATPDPASDTTQDQGQVWFTNSWAGTAAGTSADWRTQNFAVRPQPK